MTVLCCGLGTNTFLHQASLSNKVAANSSFHCCNASAALRRRASLPCTIHACAGWRHSSSIAALHTCSLLIELAKDWLVLRSLPCSPCLIMLPYCIHMRRCRRRWRRTCARWSSSQQRAPTCRGSASPPMLLSLRLTREHAFPLLLLLQRTADAY